MVSIGGEKTSMFEYVVKKIERLQQRFQLLRNDTKEHLEKCGKTVCNVADALTSIPADDQEEHKQFLESHVKVLYNASNLSELFGTMNFNWNYLNPNLLDCLVQMFHLEKMKGEMKAYKDDLKRFRENTPLELYCKTQKKRHIRPAAEFCNW